MFVLPPPPRYPSGPYGAVPGGAPLIETSNVLSHPEGLEHHLVVGEGTYVLRYDLHLATPPPHPSEAPVHNPNPLATTPSPPTAGTKLSGTILANRHNQGPRLYRFDTMSSFRSIPPSITENPKEDGSSAPSEGGSRRSNGFSDYAPRAPAFGEGNPALTVPNGKETKDPQKKRKPKTNIIKSNSAFVSRVIPHESLSKRLHEHDAGGLYVFANINRAFQWLDLSSATKEEQLTKVLFTKAHCLTHDVNQTTKNSSHLDVIMGFSTGDIIWYEPISQKYSRINKNGIVNNSAVSDIRWLPNSESLFLAAHMDGTLAVYDKEKEDAAIGAEEAVNGVANGVANGGEPKPVLRIRKSVQSKNQKSNPVACWKISNQKINNLAFSPDGRHLAVVCEDGALRVVDFLKESLLDVYQSYYGGMTCTCWSPDGKYIVTGGQDDLVSIWSLEDSMLVARCQGHNSWVTAVAFDPWRCDGRNYRFGSVGEDSRLLLWDFNVGMLHRPKAASVRQRGSISSHALRNRSESLVTRLRSNSNLSNQSTEGEETVHPVEPRAATAFLPPVLAKSVDEHPLCWLGFEEDCIITSCKEGHLKVWDRPKEGTAGAEETVSSTAGSS